MPRPPSERLSSPRVLSHLGVMLAVSAVLGVVVAGLAIPFAGVVGFATKKAADTMDDLPTELKTEPLAERSRIVDASGTVIATIYDENRVNVSLRQMSRKMVKSIVAIEDYRFYEHGALDLRGTLRALLTNQARSDVVQGGSSITQQMVKLTLLDQADTDEERGAATDDSYARKLRELRYAIAVEKNHSKDWILERYLNIAFFGDGAYGVQAAAKHYFDVNAKDLNWNQAATLAGLVQNPSRYDPTDYPDRALQRRDIVLDRMAELNVISRKKAEKLKNRGLQLDVQPSNNGCVNSRAPFFCDYVMSYLKKDKSLGRNEEERERLLKSGGLTIKTTIDLREQKAADAAVSKHVYPREQAIGGLAIVEPGTGEVKALAQSRPMGRDRKAGQTYLNYTVPQKYGDSNGFQAGSTFKVFVLAQALEQGIPLNKAFNSPSGMAFNQRDFANCPGKSPFVGSFTMPNSTTSGMKNLYSGTRESVNTFFLQLERETGVCKPFRLAKRMGVELTNPDGDAQGRGAELAPTFTLGVADASPLEMAEAYATFAARGMHCTSRPVTEIRDSAKHVVKEYPSDCNRVMQESTADAVNHVLRGVIDDGFASAQRLDQPAAGKTGTTNDAMSVWFVGYTPQRAAAAMIAGANEFGQRLELNGLTIGGIPRYSASGSAFAAPIWGDAMKVIDDHLDNEDFVYPATVPGVGQTVVPQPKPPRNGRGGDGDRGGNGNGNGNGRGRGRD